MNTSTITERPPLSGITVRSVLRAIALSVLLVAAWISTMALTMFWFEPTSAALVIGGDNAIFEKFPSETRLIRSRNRILVITAGKPGYVSTLYSAGAWLVLPALRNGCLDLGRKNRERQSG